MMSDLVRPFVTKMYNLVEAQDSLIRKAVIRSDRWRFRQEYHHLEVDQDKWFTMNEKAQKKHIQRVYAEPLSSILEVSDEEDTSSPSSASMNLSVPYKELINSYRIATSTLESSLLNTWSCYHCSWSFSRLQQSNGCITYIW